MFGNTLIFTLYLRAAEYDMAATGVDRIKRMMINWGFTAEEEVVFLSGNVDEIVSRYSSHLFAFDDLFNDLLIKLGGFNCILLGL